MGKLNGAGANEIAIFPVGAIEHSSLLRFIIGQQSIELLLGVICFLMGRLMERLALKRAVEYVHRMRWKIENEGFNIQRNGGFNMQHRFVRRSITNLHKYYIRLQIAHIIIQLTLKSKAVAALLENNKTISIKLLWTLLISNITVSVQNQEKLPEGKVKCQIRLE
jgi:hypothetical protein